jgi:hypothetical protein
MLVACGSITAPDCVSGPLCSSGPADDILGLTLSNPHMSSTCLLEWMPPHVCAMYSARCRGWLLHSTFLPRRQERRHYWYDERGTPWLTAHIKRMEGHLSVNYTPKGHQSLTLISLVFDTLLSSSQRPLKSSPLEAIFDTLPRRSLLRTCIPRSETVTCLVPPPSTFARSPVASQTTTTKLWLDPHLSPRVGTHNQQIAVSQQT